MRFSFWAFHTLGTSGIALGVLGAVLVVVGAAAGKALVITSLLMLAVAVLFGGYGGIQETVNYWRSRRRGGL